MVLVAMVKIDDVPERQFLENFFAEHKTAVVRLKQLREAYEAQFKHKPAFQVHPIEVWDSQKLWETYVPICIEKGVVTLIHM